MKIFITIGTQAPFDRLVRIVQEFADSHCTEVFIQDMDSMLTEKDLEARMQWADVIVAHAGIGTLIKTLTLGKKLVMMPRLAKLGEQRNDHQLETCEFVRKYRLAEVVESKDELFAYLSALNIQIKNSVICKRVESPIIPQTIKLDFCCHKLMAVSSFGGHSVELKQCLSEKNFSKLIYVCTGGDCDYFVENFSRNDCWKILRVMCHLWKIISKERPDMVVSTGAAPGLVAIVMAKFMGIRTVWIDSVATHTKLSVSGRLAQPFCSDFYVQWPELAKGNVKYVGNVLGI